MLRTNLRKVGGSVMMTVDPALLDLFSLQVGATVDVDVADGCFVVYPRAQAQPRYTMAQLLAASDYSQAPSDEERAWVDAPAVGDELL
jgi:antitoxin ChpS